MRIGLYARVSTSNRQDITTQTEFLKDYAERNKLEVVDNYIDIGQSGAKDSRPEFNKLIADMRAGRFQGILCYKLDRLGRSLMHLLGLFEEFKRKGINFISATEPHLCTNTPHGELILHVFMAVAQYERSLTIERVNAGLDRARKQGKRLGRPLGSKDKGRRKKGGYYLRYAKQSPPL